MVPDPNQNATAIRRIVNAGEPFYNGPPECPAVPAPPPSIPPGSNLINFNTSFSPPSGANEFINDPDNQFDYSDATRLTFNGSGIYTINFGIYCYAPDANYIFNGSLMKNGQVFFTAPPLIATGTLGFLDESPIVGTGVYAGFVGGSALIDVQAGDYIELQYYGAKPGAAADPYDVWVFPSSFLSAVKETNGAEGPQGPAGADGVIQSVDDITNLYTSIINTGGSVADIYLKQVDAGTGITITDNGTHLTFESTVSTTDVQDTGTGTPLVQNPSGNPVFIKGLTVTGSGSITDNGDSLEIAITGSSGISGVENTGVGTPLVQTPYADPVLIKGLAAGANITITDNGTNVSIASTGGGGGGDSMRMLLQRNGGLGTSINGPFATTDFSVIGSNNMSYNNSNGRISITTPPNDFRQVTVTFMLEAAAGSNTFIGTKFDISQLNAFLGGGTATMSAAGTALTAASTPANESFVFCTLKFYSQLTSAFYIDITNVLWTYSNSGIFSSGTTNISVEII